MSLIDLEFDDEDDDVEVLPDDEVPKLLELRCDVSFNPPSSAIKVKAPKRVYPMTRTQTPRLENAEEGTDKGQKQQQHQEEEPLLRRCRLFPLLQQIPRRRLQQPLVEDADDGDDGGDGGGGWWVW